MVRPVKSEKEKAAATQVIAVANTDLDFRKDRYILLEIYGRDIGKRRDISKDGIIIGRSEDCDIPIDDQGISRRHCKIIKQGKEFMALDLNSTNGTYLNDKKLDATTILHNGDRIKLGNTIFKFICSDDMEAEYYDQLYQYSIKDGLTGLYNKKTLTENLEKEFKRCKRYQRCLSVMMLDIDFFKKINDTYGHIVGDKVIVTIAEILKNYFRTSDFIARFGGEEFSVVLPETPLSSAHLTAERIRMAVSNIRINDSDREVTVTISIGVAAYSEEMSTFTQLLEKADEFLYRAKKNGRNRVES